MKALLLVVAVAAVSSCLPSIPPARLFGGASRPPAPSRAAILAAGERADNSRTDAFAAAGAVALGEAFAGEALIELRGAAQHMVRLGQRIERRLESRLLVHWSVDGETGSGVLALSGWSRLVAGSTASAWSRFLEEWSFTVQWLAGGWRVVQAADLPPGSWWQ